MIRLQFTVMDHFAAPSSCHISVHTRHRITTVQVHNHALICVQHGTKTLLSATASQVFRAGDAVIILQGSAWDVINDPSPDTRYEASVLEFGDGALNALADLVPITDKPPPSGGFAAPSMTDELIHAIHRAMETIARPDSSLALRQHRTVEVLLLLAEQGIRLEPHGELHWKDRIRRLVAQRPYADWSAEVLADAFNVSQATLRRRMAAEGSRASDIVRETRLEISLNLLQTTSMAIGEIAQRCGYESHSRFSAAFRDRFGFAPSDLRLPDNNRNLSVHA